jgi:hypothetical protein
MSFFFRKQKMNRMTSNRTFTINALHRSISVQRNLKNGLRRTENELRNTENELRNTENGLRNTENGLRSSQTSKTKAKIRNENDHDPYSLFFIFLFI